MLIPLLHRLVATNPYHTYQHIMDVYTQQGYAIIHFLYFASLNNIVGHDIHNSPLTMQDHIYYESLMSSDLILPDGIALQLLYYTWAKRKKFIPPTACQRLPNLNGTDFLPYFLQQLYDQYSIRHPINIILYGSYIHIVTKAAEYLMQRGLTVIQYQDGYNPIDRNKIKDKTDPKAITILLIGRGSPLQEIWAHEHKKHIEEYRLLAFTVGGLLDFRGGKEQRAPKIIRVLKGERVRRLLLNPHKNRSKFLSSFRVFPTLFTQKSIESS